MLSRPEAATGHAGKRSSAARDFVRQSRRHDRSPRRRHHLSQAQNGARRISGAPDRSPAPLGQARAEPHLHGGARRRRRLAANHLRAIAGFDPEHRFGAARARSLGRRPIVILSGNSIDHALVAFGALYAGIPFCPVSPAYSLVSKDYGKLAYLMKLLTPGLVFADDAGKFADALARQCSRCKPRSSPRVAKLPGRGVTMLADLLATPEHPAPRCGA